MKAMYKIPRCHDQQIFKLEISHLICLFQYISKHWNNSEIKVLQIMVRQIYYNII